MKQAIFLFDYTCIMAQPWLEAGYECWCIDGQHALGITKEGKLNKVGMWLDHDNIVNQCCDIIDMVGEDIEFIFGFPECTDLAVSGAAHFNSKREKNQNFQEEALQFVHLVRELGEILDTPWGLENPISVISSKWRKPDFMFNPCDYGGYLPEDDIHPLYPDYLPRQDAYNKKTCIWHGSGFVRPDPKPVELAENSQAYYSKLGGKSLKTKNIRSATPRGFARAVFEANNRPIV